MGVWIACSDKDNESLVQSNKYKLLRTRPSLTSEQSTPPYVRSGGNKDLVRRTRVHDVTPLTLGVETTLDHTMAVVTPRNTAIPVKMSKNFTTLLDNLVSTRISVYEVESPSMKDNNQLGEFVLTGIHPAPKGVLVIIVTLGIDVNGILYVSAEDETSGRANSMYNGSISTRYLSYYILCS
jgi:molecular chaperone DnaK (HSP70)